MTLAIHVVDLITSDEDQKFAPAGRMAAVIIDITHECGGCLPQDLNARGFTPAEVAQHWHLAKSLAEVEMKLMRDQPTLASEQTVDRVVKRIKARAS